ncbi:hypothetical protein OG588_00310 [Streptomyces prunicolor]|nr:hypothetical protein OG588_00310 [Streptomyces prunicolor]
MAARLCVPAQRIEADLCLGGRRELLPGLKVLVNRYRRRESLHGRFMVALDREGRCGCAPALVAEPGLEPSAPLSRLRCSILTARLGTIPVAALVGGATR